MKPIDGRGARGTFLLNKIEDLKKYFSKSMENSEKKRSNYTRIYFWTTNKHRIFYF